jgi:hypothetical protein
MLRKRVGIWCKRRGVEVVGVILCTRCAHERKKGKENKLHGSNEKLKGTVLIFKEVMCGAMLGKD